MKLYEPFQFLSAEECDRIIEYGRQNQIKDATNPARKNRIVWYWESEQWQKWIAGSFHTLLLEI